MQNIHRATQRQPFGRSTFNQTANISRMSYSKDKLINIQKRDKLKGLLITKFMKKYGIKNPEILLQDEISKFLEGEKLTDSDLKKLDEKLKKMLIEINTQENLKKNLSLEPQSHNSENFLNLNNRELILPDLHNDGKSVHSKISKKSKSSTVSKLNREKFDNKSVISDYDDLNSISGKNSRLERFDFEDHKDEWNAIVAYNKKLHEEEIKQNKLKDLEIKRRIREDLDNQIRQKLKRTQDETVKNMEYDAIILNHCEYLNELEKKRQQEVKDRIMREKENRDKQLKDEKYRKKIEHLKEKKYDKESVKNLVSDLEKDKQNQIKKKIEEKENMQKTLQENEFNRIKQIENMKKEKLDDIKATEEYSKIMDRQEQERGEYFNKIERNSNNFINKMADNVLNNLDKKNKEEDDRLKSYMDEKERRLRDEEDKKKKVSTENKKNMRDYLDMQVDEKKRAQYFERCLDGEQARIWKIDTEKFFDQEKEINDKVRSLNFVNSQYLKNQIDVRHSKKANKMNDTEYALNQQLLERIKNSPN